MTVTTRPATDLDEPTRPRRLGTAYAMLFGVALHTLGVWLLVRAVNATLRTPSAGVDMGAVLLSGLVGSIGLVVMLTTAFGWALRRHST